MTDAPSPGSRRTPCRGALCWFLGILCLSSPGSLSPRAIPAPVPELSADDWPMWRRDAQRSAASPKALPDALHVQWVHRLPPLRPAYRSRRLGFDRGYEPVVLGDTMFIASSRNDSVTALDLESGRRKWRRFADGPVRFAPVAWRDRVYFGSDDGHLHCVDAERGDLIWKFRAVPSRRKLLGNRRLISVWPIRGGPVLSDGTVYLAAGVWSFEGTFVHALDAESGRQLWVNDRSGHVYGQHPHGAEAFGGLSPQGYLLIGGDELIVPCGTAYPARFDRATGELRSFALPRRSRYPGGWFAYVDPERFRDLRRGKLSFDSEVNQERHEDRPMRGEGEAGSRSVITLGGKKLSFRDDLPGVEGRVHSLLAARDRLFAVTEEGSIYCLGAEARRVRVHEEAPRPLAERQDEWTAEVQGLLGASGSTHGYALVFGVPDGRLLEELVRQSSLHIVALDPDPEKVDALRRRFDAAGLYGTRVAVHVGEPEHFGLPPYLANLIVAHGPPPSRLYLSALFRSLRPFGGTACLRLPANARDAFRRQVREAGLERAVVRQDGELTLLIREGALPGSTDYTGGWKSPDRRVGAPLGVLWFDDSLAHFKRSPQPKFVGGWMISRPKDWKAGRPDARQGYRLLPETLSDVYTGRVLSGSEATRVKQELPGRAWAAKQPVQYRPPTQKNAWKPEKPVVGERRNPLTGGLEPRVFPKSYGCDGGIDYGLIFTMRSGTPAFYDKQLESGTVNISGPRSGCTNSVIPANGVLNVPFFYEGCTCSYPLPVGLALVKQPPEFEQWTAWGAGPTEKIQRLGVNLGAPGDRVSPGGTLWLDVPGVGGPFPDVPVRIEPENPRYHYRHSLWIRGGRGWPWVAASGAQGISRLSISGLQPASYRVRLTFAEPREIAPGERTFSVSLQGRPVLEDLDVAREAAGHLRGLVREFRDVRSSGELEVTLHARRGDTLLSGVEVIREGLPAGEIWSPENRR